MAEIHIQTEVANLNPMLPSQPLSFCAVLFLFLSPVSNVLASSAILFEFFLRTGYRV